MTTLNVSCKIGTATGLLELEDLANGYELHKDAFAQRAVSHRKQEISSEWLEGSYITRGVRENIIEPLVVWVSAATPFALQQRIEVLTGALEQLSYQITQKFADSQEVWNCELADYTIEASQEFRFATLALVRAQVPRLPTLTRTQVTP